MLEDLYLVFLKSLGRLEPPLPIAGYGSVDE